MDTRTSPIRLRLEKLREVLTREGVHALLVPSAAVHGYDGRQGTVWTGEEGRLHRRPVRFRHRTEDGRLEIVDGVNEGARVVISLDSGFKEGRAARVSEARPQ